MRIGPKVVAAFLAVSLVPTALLVWQGNRSIRHLGDELSARARSFLENRVSDDIRAAAQNAAALIEQQKRLVDLALDYQVSETAAALSGPLPAVTPYPFVLAGSDAQTAGGKAGNSSAGSDEAVQTIYLAPGVTPQAASGDIQRLSLLTPVYKTLADRHEGLFQRMFTTLESGVDATFPARASFPKGYDPREQRRYWTTIEAGHRLWQPMHQDARVGGRVITVTAPVTLKDGRYAGVAGIEVRLVDLLRRADEADRLPKDARGLLVTLTQQGGPPDVVARLKAGAGEDWQDVSGGSQLVNGDTQAWQHLLAGLRAGRSGTQRVTLDGEDSLMAFAPVALGKDTHAYLLIGVPYAQLSAEASAAGTVVRTAIDNQLRWSGIIAIAVLAGVAVLAILAARRLTRPVEELAAAAERLADGDFDTRVEPRGDDELGDLGRGFNQLAPRLGEIFQVEKSLELARDVQQHLLPSRPPRLAGFDIAGTSVYCDQTGGDYLDYIELDRAGRGRLGVAVGDVSGHGVPAALLMTTARALLRGYASEAQHACDLVDEVNAHLSRDVQGGQFMTLFLMVISRESRTLEYVSAGHEPAFYYCPGDDDFHDLEEGGIPLGIDAQWHYESHAVEGCLTPGRVVVVATDGVWEARNPAGEMFGKERLRALVRQHHRESAERIRIAITDAIEAFRAGVPASDDVTLAVVKVLNGGNGDAEA